MSAGFIQNELDLKLLVLYIMARTAHPVTFPQLLELALCDAGVNYFSLTQAVDHMVETGQLARDGERYSITEKGQRNSEICQSSLPYSVRMHCDENLLRVNDALRREAQIQADVQDREDGTCTLLLRFSDGASPLLELSLLVPDRAMALSMAQVFRNDPASICHGVISLLQPTGSSDGEEGAQ